MKPLILTHAQVTLFLECDKDPKALWISSLQKRIGWWNLTDALKAKGLIVNQGDIFTLTEEGRKMYSFIVERKNKPVGQILVEVANEFSLS